MAAALESAEDELSCPICLELFVDPHTPKNLPSCGHVCCEICLKKMANGKCLQTCPECRKDIKITASGITSFTTNYRLRSLAENHQQKVRNDQLQSQMCLKKKGVPLCSDHDDEKMHYYCVTCKCLACQACLTLKHNGTEHDIEGVKEMCRRQKDEIKSACARAKAGIDVAKCTLDELKIVDNQNIELYKDMEKQVDKYTEFRIKKLLAESQELKKQIEQVMQMKAEDLKRESSTVQKYINSAEVAYQATVNAKENLSDYEYITQHALLINKMEELQISNLTTLTAYKQKDVIKFMPMPSHIKIGHIISVTPGKVRKIEAIQTLVGFRKACELDCSPDGLLAIIDFWNNYVVIYHYIMNGFYEKKCYIKLASENQFRPSGIAICPDGRFIVARHTYIEVYSPDGIHENDIKIKDGEVDVHLVAVTPAGRILIGDYSTSLVREVCPTGEVSKTIHTRINPSKMTIIHNTHIAISNASVGKVIVIDIESGEETLSIDIPQVHGICYDEHTDCLLTARSEPVDGPGEVLANTGVLEQYSCTTGALIACLQRGLYCPIGMALTSDGHFFVANTKNVEIYEIQ